MLYVSIACVGNIRGLVQEGGGLGVFFNCFVVSSSVCHFVLSFSDGYASISYKYSSFGKNNIWVFSSPSVTFSDGNCDMVCRIIYRIKHDCDLLSASHTPFSLNSFEVSCVQIYNLIQLNSGIHSFIRKKTEKKY